MQITTLIPAYKPQYLIELLTCLRHQTVKPSRVIFSDDSPDRAFITSLSTEPLKSLVSDLNIEVVQGPRTGGYNNCRHLMNIYRLQTELRTELFHLLLDDDIIYPGFYEQHLQVHSNGWVPCAISRRWAASEYGMPIKDDLPIPPAIKNHANRVLGLTPQVLFSQTVGACRNWLGEFSNATFRSEMADHLGDLSMAGISYAGLDDLGSFLKVSTYGPIAYLQDYLGMFRFSENQVSSKPMERPMKLAFLAYISLAVAGRKMNFLSQEQARVAILHASHFILQHYHREADMQDICSVLRRLAEGAIDSESDFLKIWQVFSITPAQPLPA